MIKICLNESVQFNSQIGMNDQNNTHSNVGWAKFDSLSGTGSKV